MTGEYAVLFLHDRYIFVTVDLLREGQAGGTRFRAVGDRSGADAAKAAICADGLGFLPDHWHAIIYPRYPVSISRAMSAVKVSSMIAINHGWQGEGELWQERFPSLGSGQAFDQALRTVKDCWGTVEYIHSNPVRRGLVERPEQ